MLKGLSKWVVLNGKSVRELIDIIENQWGCSLSNSDGFGFLQNKEGDVFLISRSVESLDLESMNIESLGLYFGQLHNGELRLSIEGSQIVGMKAIKNVAVLSEQQAREWISGSEISTDSELKGFVIVRQGDDFLGCGKFKDGKILNYVPKARRISNT